MTLRIITKEPTWPTKPVEPNQTIEFHKELDEFEVDDFLDIEINAKTFYEKICYGPPTDFDENKHFIKIIRRWEDVKTAFPDYGYEKEFNYYIVLFEKQDKPNLNYEKEMEDYKKLELQYNEDLKKYFEDNANYLKTQDKIKELANEIRRLSANGETE